MTVSYLVEFENVPLATDELEETVELNAAAELPLMRVRKKNICPC